VSAVPIPSDQIPVGEGLHPDGQPGACFFIGKRELELIRKTGPRWKYEDARFITEAVRDPDVIFEGLKRHDQQDNLCYSVRPTIDPDDEDSGLPKYHYVFLVFVSLHMGYVIFDWEWREEDPERPGYPLNWQDDFARSTWSRT
jgi:hypothetical protein